MPRPDPNAPARRKAEAMVRQAAELTRRTAETAAQQQANIEELAALHQKNAAEMAANQAASMAAMVATQGERMEALAAKTAEVAGLASEIVGLLTDEPVTPPPPPPKPMPVDLFLEPFSDDSAHRTRLGPKVEYGIPPGTLNAKVASPVYDAGRLGSRGRLAIVGTFRCGATSQGRKRLMRVSPSDPERRVVWHRSGGTGDGLPATLRMPAYARGRYPATDGDNELLLYGGDGDIVHVMAQFQFREAETAAEARARRSYSLGGRDVRHRWNDPGEWGPGAIDWRHPGGFLRGREVDLTGAAKIRHVLNATATRHSRAGARPDQHILSKRMCFPAWEVDRPMRAEDNLGDIPYGTIIAIRRQDAGLRETLGLTAFGKRLFDTFLEHGCCLCDGQGQIVDDAPVLQLRIDADLAEDGAKVRAVDEALMKILPHLWPVFNPRRHDGEDQRHSDGLVYIGGGGPL